MSLCGTDFAKRRPVTHFHPPRLVELRRTNTYGLHCAVLATTLSYALNSYAAGEVPTPDNPTSPNALATRNPRVTPDNDPSATTEPQTNNASSRPMSGGIGAQLFLARDKFMPGVLIQGSTSAFYVSLEGSLIWLTRGSRDFDGRFLGNQFSATVGVNLFPRSRFETIIGAGPEGYWLWGIYSGAREFALSLRAEVHYWFRPNAAVFVGVRGYPLATEGLELGKNRDGTHTLPLLFSFGIETGVHR